VRAVVVREGREAVMEAVGTEGVEERVAVMAEPGGEMATEERREGATAAVAAVARRVAAGMAVAVPVAAQGAGWAAGWEAATLVVEERGAVAKAGGDLAPEAVGGSVLGMAGVAAALVVRATASTAEAPVVEGVREAVETGAVVEEGGASAAEDTAAAESAAAEREAVGLAAVGWAGWVGRSAGTSTLAYEAAVTVAAAWGGVGGGAEVKAGAELGAAAKVVEEVVVVVSVVEATAPEV
jgi:hypothetical protein